MCQELGIESKDKEREIKQLKVIVENQKKEIEEL